MKWKDINRKNTSVTFRKQTQMMEEQGVTIEDCEDYFEAHTKEEPFNRERTQRVIDTIKEWKKQRAKGDKDLGDLTELESDLERIKKQSPKK